MDLKTIFTQGLGIVAMAFNVLSHQRNLILEFLPLMGMVAITISFRLSDTKAIRKYARISSPCWLIYNIANGSIGAIICEVLSLGSILMGMLRLDRTRGTRKG